MSKPVGKVVLNVRLVKHKEVKARETAANTVPPTPEPRTGEDLYRKLKKQFSTDVLVLHERRHKQLVELANT